MALVENEAQRDEAELEDLRRETNRAIAEVKTEIRTGLAGVRREQADSRKDNNKLLISILVTLIAVLATLAGTVLAGVFGS